MWSVNVIMGSLLNNHARQTYWEVWKEQWTAIIDDESCLVSCSSSAKDFAYKTNEAVKRGLFKWARYFLPNVFPRVTVFVIVLN